MSQLLLSAVRTIVVTRHVGHAEMQGAASSAEWQGSWELLNCAHYQVAVRIG
jgi:hypothetical protein